MADKYVCVVLPKECATHWWHPYLFISVCAGINIYIYIIICMIYLNDLECKKRNHFSTMSINNSEYKQTCFNSPNCVILPGSQIK